MMVKTMELLDIYYAYGNKSGKLMERGAQLEPGEYYLSVHIYIYNSKGEFLLQKRSMKLKDHDGLWEITSGCVTSGEDSLEAAMREVYEELGIYLDEEQMKYMGCFRRKSNLIDIWFAKSDCAAENYCLNSNEVVEVKLVPAEEMIKEVWNFIGREEAYKQLVTEFIREISAAQRA